MATEGPSLVTIDEDARRRFEAAWQDGRPEPIEQFLPFDDHAGYLATLEELIYIELEFAWKSWRGQSTAKTSAAVGRPARVEAYLVRFARLNEAPLILRLLRQEYRVRHDYGDCPSAEEYTKRFPTLVVTGIEVQGESPEDAAGAAELPNIPGYQILGFLGRGGMGAVFKARQVSLNRVVALKMILAGSAASAKELARFHTEAEAVARLQHPNIVQIHDVGQHQGRPYLALEFVEGGTLAHKLAGTPQPARQAAQLVETLARAMHVAHQHGIVHRDLKPANVLLSGQWRVASSEQDKDPPSLATRHSPLATPKITDFGLAKLLDTESGQTTAGVPMGTPSYMAPEQAVGKAAEIGPATDTYALGAILYEMLTGRPPFRGETPLSTMEQVRSQDAVPPSQLHPKVPRDLETICLKCLEKQPRKRYATAQELADDLGRFLAGEPIRARPTAAWERGLKWVKRRPALAALLGVSGVAAVAVLAVVLISHARLQEQRDYAEDQRKEAVANFKKARDAVDLMLTRVGQESLAHVPHMEKIRRELLEDALRFYQEFSQQTSNDSEVRYETGRAYRRLGVIYNSLGDREKAEQSFREALAVQQELLAKSPTDLTYRRELAVGYRNLGGLLPTHRHQEAEAAFRQALDLQEKLTAADPVEAVYSADLADTHDSVGILLAQMQRHSEAETAFRHATDLLEKLVPRFPSVADYGERLAVYRGNLANLLAKTNRLEEAEKVQRQNVDFWERRASGDPSGANARSKLAITCYNLGFLLHNLGRPVEAEPAIRRALELRTKFMEDFPNVPHYQHSVGDILRKLAVLVAVNRGEYAEARRLVEQAIGHTKAALKTDPQNPAFLRSLGYQYATLADRLIELEEHAEAARAVEEVPALLESVEDGYRDTARRLARCVQLASKDAKLSEDKRKELSQAYADRAVQLLRQAIQRIRGRRFPEEQRGLRVAAAARRLQAVAGRGSLTQAVAQPRSRRPSRKSDRRVPSRPTVCKPRGEA